MAGDYTEKVSLPCHKRGDKWPGIYRIGPILINGETPSKRLDRVIMHFKSRTGDVFRLDSSLAADKEGEIVIDDGHIWQASIPQVLDFLQSSGDWKWDMEFYSQGETAPLTLYKGVLRVTNDITK